MTKRRLFFGLSLLLGLSVCNAADAEVPDNIRTFIEAEWLKKQGISFVEIKPISSDRGDTKNPERYPLNYRLINQSNKNICLFLPSIEALKFDDDKNYFRTISIVRDYGILTVDGAPLPRRNGRDELRPLPKYLVLPSGEAYETHISVEPSYARASTEISGDYYIVYAIHAGDCENIDQHPWLGFMQNFIHNLADHNSLPDDLKHRTESFFASKGGIIFWRAEKVTVTQDMLDQ